MKIHSIPAALLVLMLTLGFWSCNIINPEETVPTFVHIDTAYVLPQSDSFGTTSSKITNVTAYFDGQLLGIFNFPATIPIPTTHTGELRLVPGIDINGIRNATSYYPFYAFDSLTVTPQPGKVIDKTIYTKYTSASILKQYVNFELSSSFVAAGGDTSMAITHDPEYVFEGKGAGLVYLSKSGQESVSLSTTPFQGAVGQSCYVELNYKCSVPFEVGVYARYPDESDNEYLFSGGVNPRSTWNKIYISLSDFVGRQSKATYYVVIRAYSNDDNPQGFVAVDNVKVLAF